MGALQPTTALDEATTINTYRIGDYVKITGLFENTELNGQLGVVIPKRNPLEKERISVRVFSNHDACQDGFSKRDISIRTSNLVRMEKPASKPEFSVTRKVLAALYNSGPRARRVLHSNSRSAIQQEILSVLGNSQLLEDALLNGEKALNKQAELTVFVDTLLLCLRQ